MKTRLLNLLAILMVTMMSVNFMSCSSDDKENEKDVKIVGTWQLSGDELIYVFNSDGTGYGLEYVYRDGKMVFTDRWDITYVYDENKGTLVYIEVGDTEVWDVIALTENSLVVREQGENRTLTFIRQDNLDLGTTTTDIGLKLASIGDYKLTYNNDGKLKTAVRYSNSKEKYRYEFSYAPNIETIYDEYGEEESVMTLTYNSSGFITKMVGNYAEENVNYKFTYDNDGHLVKGEGEVSEVNKNGSLDIENVSFTVTWSNNLLLSSTVIWSSGTEIKYTFSYGNSNDKYNNKNKYLQYGPVGYLLFDDDLFILAEEGCFGKGPAYLPINSYTVEKYEGRTYETIQNYSYTFNDNGSLNSYLIEREGSSSHTQFYSYYDK